MRTPKLKFTVDRAGKHRWHLTAGNGRIIDASSQGFASKAMAEKNLRLVRDAMAVAEEVEA